MQASASSATETSEAKTKEEDQAVKGEFAISSSREDDVGSDDASAGADEDAGDSSSAPPTIRLNPRARKVGAPKKLKGKTVASEKNDRKWFDAAEEGRKTAGEVTLKGLMEALDREQPGLAETRRRLSGVLVKYAEADRKKPKYKRMINPVLILDLFYILPSKLLNACLGAFPVSNTKETAIPIDASQTEDRASRNEVPEKAKGGAEAVEVVQIKDVGVFSRSQIETFKRVENMKMCVQLGLDMHKWLTEQGIPSLPAEYHDYRNDVAAEILSTYPHKRIQGLPTMADFDYSMLYRATAPTWLTDASIRALCLRLSSDYPSCRFTGFPSVTATKKRTRGTEQNMMEKTTRERVVAQVEEPGVDTVMLPLNFSNAHWC
jgi:hypothetical protein